MSTLAVPAGDSLSTEKLASMIDASCATAAATREEVKEFLDSLAGHDWAAVMVEPSEVKFARPILTAMGQRLVTVLAYPLGAYTTEVKVVQAEQAIEDGADELDIAMNLSAFRSGDYKRVVEDLAAVRRAATGHLVKVIYYSAILDDADAIRAAQLALDAGVDFLKTNPGYGNLTTPHHISVVKERFGTRVKVMASGGVRTQEDALAMVEAGADRIATSSPMTVLGLA